MTGRADVRLMGFPDPEQREMMAAFAKACGGELSADGLSFTVTVTPEMQAQMQPLRGEVGAFNKALERLLAQ